MRIRQPFAAAFAVILLAAGYMGLGPITIPYSEYHSDKVLHFVTFFLLTLTFYWIVETTRRRILHLSFVVCTLTGAVGSEILQGVLPNNRDFDYLDILANVVGSLAALGLCAAYHKRMLERKRTARGYRSAAGEEDLEGGEEDVELEEGTGPQETGVTQPETNLDAELDNWDENAEDEWEDPGAEHGGAVAKTVGEGVVVNGGPPPDAKAKRED